MQVKYVLFVIYCAVPLLLHMVNSQEHCNFTGITNETADCTPSDTSRTFDYVPRISHRITYINLDGQPLKQLPRNAFRNISSQNELVSISLITCQIQHIDADAFLNLDNLKHLSVIGNRFSHFETGTFQHIKQLEQLIANNNKIDKLQTGLFHNLVNLKEVSFKNNNINCIDKDTFRNTSSLFRIDVRYNRLEYLSPLFTDNFINITELYVEANPWNCDCNLKELYELNKVKIPKKYTEPRCENPPELRGMKWFDLTSDAFMCDTQIILPTNDTRVVTPGSTVTLSCAVHGDPVPDIKWHRDTHIIPLDKMFISSNMNMHYLNYTFTVQEDDLGTYQCIVNNTRDVQESSTTLTMADTSSIREHVSTITINEPGIIIKESGTRIKELSTSNGPNATTTVEVTMNVVLQVPKNLSWWGNVHITRVTKHQSKHPNTTEENGQPSAEDRNAQSSSTREN